MRALLRRLEEGRYQVNFREIPYIKGSSPRSPDERLMARPARGIAVHLSRFDKRWHVDIFDDDVADEGSANAQVVSQPLARGLSRDEAQQAAAEVFMDYASRMRE